MNLSLGNELAMVIYRIRIKLIGPQVLSGKATAVREGSRAHVLASFWPTLLFILTRLKTLIFKWYHQNSPASRTKHKQMTTAIAAINTRLLLKLVLKKHERNKKPVCFSK